MYSFGAGKISKDIFLYGYLMMQYQLRFDFAVLSFSLLFNFSQSLICTNGGYCTDDADCVPGNFCRFSENYSQCQINPDQGACLAIYATCGGVPFSFFLFVSFSPVIFPSYYFHRHRPIIFKWGKLLSWNYLYIYKCLLQPMPFS